MLLNKSAHIYALTICTDWYEKSCELPFGLRPWTIFSGASVYQLKI
jgi:hypothetical protein